MKISYNWLKDYVTIDAGPEIVADKLSLAGFEVEEVLEKRLDYPGVVVGKVLEVRKHPNADRLSVCEVDVGSEQLTIVCGAPNVAANQLVPVATVGAELPGGFKIKKAKLRGVASRGMICSEKELGVSEEAAGIWVLPGKLTVGEKLAAALSFETDYVFDIGVTPNRPDALSHLGIGREVAALFDRELKRPEVKISEIEAPTEDAVQVEIRCPESCPRYSARLIKNLRPGPSPQWLKRRLNAVGIRSINNLVDITNYVMMETGQPLHAFDFDEISGQKIIVRESVPGEKFVTLDEKEHELQGGTVLICDAQKPVAIGGIMGGLNSEVKETTRTVLLESAYFQPENIQRSLRYLGMRSEASHRFERGVDPNGAIFALNRAAQLFSELAGGEVLRGEVDQYPRKITPVKVDLRSEKINILLGTRLTAGEMRAILEKIELKVDGQQVTVPTFRPDITRTADVAEEIARLYGLDNIDAAEVTSVPYIRNRNYFDEFLDEVREALVGMGIQETVTNSMVSSEFYRQITGEEIYPIMNPVSADMSGMRNTLILSGLGVLQWNVNRQQRDLKIFEINRIFLHPGNLQTLPREETHLGIFLTGRRNNGLWGSDKQLVDFYDIKGVFESVCDKFSLDNIELISYDNFAVGFEAVEIRAKNKRIGFLGRIKEPLQQKFNIETAVYAAELNLNAVYDLRRKEKKYQVIPRFPYVERDIALVLNEQIPAADILRTFREAGGKLLREVTVFDIYHGNQVAEGKKSLALRLRFLSEERTLVEEEVNQAVEAILKKVAKTHQAVLR